MSRILCVGAHCDDIEIGCAGTILHHLERDDSVSLLVMTGFGRRAKEAEEAGRALGVSEVRVLNFEDTEIPSGIDAITAIEGFIELCRPTRIYTHTTKDTHQDHRNTGLASLSAGRRVPQILFYESAPPKSWAFSPNYYIDISGYMERKMEVLRLFESQRERWYMRPEVIRSMARFRGLEIGVEYAEAFEIYKFLEV